MYENRVKNSLRNFDNSTIFRRKSSSDRSSSEEKMRRQLLKDIREGKYIIGRK